MTYLKSISKFLLTLCILSAWLLTACHSGKSVPKTNTGSVTAGLPASATDISLSIESYRPWERVKIPVTLRLREPKSISVSGNAVMERDKSIMISLRFFGMEIGNIYLTDDSLTAIDKFNKKYVSEAIRPLLGGFPVTISNVQDILLGRPFVAGSQLRARELTKDFEIERSGADGGFSLIPRDMPPGVEYGFAFSAAGDLMALLVKAGSHQPVTVGYEDSRATQFGPFAGGTSVEASAGKTAIDATLEWNFGKASWDEKVELRRPSVPSNYERVNAQKLIKAFTNL